MTVRSSGLLPFRVVAGQIEVFVTHMGGPFWEHKDDGAWSIAKGEYDPHEESPLQVARREFQEEVGLPAPEGDPIDLGEVELRSGKRVQVHAVATDEELHFVASNTFTMEWPRHSGVIAEFPEADGAAWFGIHEARRKVLPSQLKFLDRLQAHVDRGAGP